MKKAIIVLTISILAASFLAGCGTINAGSGEIKTIHKPASSDIQEPGAASNQTMEPVARDSDLNGKNQVLQADTEEYIKNVLSNKLTEIMTALRDYDLEKLSEYVHPEKGLRFSPYTHVNVDSDLVFTKDQIKAMSLDTSEYLWGSYDASGEPIKLTFGDYYEKFIYDADFMNAELHISNTKLPNHGSMMDNSFDVYKNSIMAEFYIPGIDPQYEGMDWRSLRLVFEKQDDAWYLTGIIHGQWTP